MDSVEQRILRFGKAHALPWMEQAQLRLHPEKTKVVDATQRGGLAAAFLSALRLQHCRQPSGTRARGRDFGSNSVAEPYAVKAVTVMSYVFNCLQVHYGVPADLDERIAA
jgi:hypothetical protein